MAAVGLVVGAELRRRWTSLVLIALVVAVVTATTVAATAGSRRTSTVLDRFLAGTAAHDLKVSVLSPEFPLDPDRVDALRVKLAAVTGVEAVSAMTVAPVGADGTQYDFGIIASPDGGYYRDVDRPIVLAGRLPALDAVDEIAVNESAAREFDLAVGDVFEGPTFDPQTVAGFLSDAAVSTEATGPAVALEVVGIVRIGDELSIRPQSVHRAAIASPAFFRANADEIGFSVAQYALHVDRSMVDLDEVLAVVRADIGTDWETFGQWIEEQYAGEAANAYRALAIGLLVFAAVAGVVGLLAVLQAVNRHIAVSAGADQVLAEMGMPRRRRAMALGGGSALAVVGGVVAGLAAAIALSPLFPMSLARRAELARGVDIDRAVLAAAGVVAVAVFLAVVAWSAHRATATRRPAGSRQWPAQVARAVRWTGPSAGIGVAMALDPGRGRRGVPARSALLGAALGVAGVVAAGVFVSSVHAARDDPTRFGWTWDAQPDLLVSHPERVVARMAEDPDLDAIAEVNCGPVGIADESVYGCAFDDWKGSTTAPVTAGRLPVGPGEVALGRITRQHLGAAIGDDVRTSTGATLTVVGEAVIPLIDNSEPGEGAVLTSEGLAAARETVGGRYLLLTYAAGTDRAALEARLASDYGATATRYSEPEPPGKLLQLDAMTGLLGALGAFLATLGVVGLVHFLAVSVRRRRREFAVLRSLGFVRRDVGLSVSWQAGTVAAVGVVVGIPLGVVIGRWTWLTAIRSVGMIDTPAVSPSRLAVVALVAVAGAALVGAVPGLMAARRRPAAGLRAE